MYKVEEIRVYSYVLKTEEKKLKMCNHAQNVYICSLLRYFYDCVRRMCKCYESSDLIII